jgi:hypothetical protein
MSRSELQERMDAVGGASATEYHRSIFLWMEQATREIKALRQRVAAMEKEAA